MLELELYELIMVKIISLEPVEEAIISDKYCSHKPQAHLAKMCHYQPWEDDSPSTEDHARSTRNGTNTVVTGWHSWETRIAMLEARIARVEARLDGLEARMFYQQKALRVISVLLLVTLAYAIWK
ncbi:hypothetical protein CRYUN_Cryun27aG0026600 [Craigia yunnanensis]